MGSLERLGARPLTVAGPHRDGCGGEYVGGRDRDYDDDDDSLGSTHSGNGSP